MVWYGVWLWWFMDCLVMDGVGNGFLFFFLFWCRCFFRSCVGFG